MCDPADIAAKFAAFGWDVRTIDGHDMEQIVEALSACKGEGGSKPHAVIANTVKGKGVSFMENQAGWHGKAPKPDELEVALADLERLCGKGACRE